MNSELTQKLQERYPRFFRDLYGDPTKTCMAFGINCGDGWFGLLEKLCTDIAAASPPEDFKFDQIKEKFGGLRVYVSGANRAGFLLCNQAEEDSLTVCECCGSKENITTEGSWLRTLCPACRALQISHR